MKTILRLTSVCTLLLLTSCNSFFKFSKSSSTPEQSELTWFAKIIQDGNQHELEALTLHFSVTGKVMAKCSNYEVNGYWYEDEITNKFILSFEPNQLLCKLNKSWDVQLSNSSKIILTCRDKAEPLTLTLRIP